MLSVILFIVPKPHYAVILLDVVMLSVILLDVVMLSVILLIVASVIMLSFF
jgi:hypothetical protein